MEHGGGAMSEHDDDRARAGLEAARLLGAAQDWLRTSAPHLAPVSTGGEPCSCPLCRLVVSVREADPDAVASWVDSAVAAATAALAQVSERLAPDANSPDGDADTDGYASDGFDTDGHSTDGYASDGDDTDGDDADGTAADADDVSEALKSEGTRGADLGPGQDVPRDRAVRRIPLDLDPDAQDT
jgi:hypothetical protein